MDSRTNRYDLIIAGAGAAGLNLLHHLLSSSLENRAILLIDTAFEPIKDRTWCFWSRNDPWMGDLCYSWETLRIQSHGALFEETLKNYRYYCLPGELYTAHLLEEAEKHRSVTLLEARIEGFDNNSTVGEVITNNGTYTAPWIFQSVQQPPQLKSAIVDNDLLQHFTGWEIETGRPAFDPSRIVFMDFDVEQKNGLTFFYMLPFSDKKALVEHTLFSEEILKKSDYEKAIRSYLNERYGLGDGEYRIIRRESGIIPMNDRRVPDHLNDRTCNLGIVGGLTKASTGYTFMRIDTHSRMIVNALESGKMPPVWPGSSYRFRVYDMMLLYLLRCEPDHARQIFHRLFEKNRFDTILAFLDEQSHFGQELSIFSRLPYRPFFRSIVKMSHRIFSGA